MQGRVSPAPLRLGAVSPRSWHRRQRPAKPEKRLADAAQHADTKHRPGAGGQRLQVTMTRSNEMFSQRISGLLYNFRLGCFARGVQDFLNHEHRVFNSEEFLRSREPADQCFYKKVRSHVYTDVQHLDIAIKIADGNI